MSGKKISLFAAALLSSLAVSAAVFASDIDEPVTAVCKDVVPPTVDLAFDQGDDKHELWYARYWTGDCVGLSLFGDRCLQGDPNWNDQVAELMSRGGRSGEEQIKDEACRVGHIVGLEWARQNDVRCITTDDVKVWGRELEETADILADLNRIREQAEGMLGCTRD